MFLEACWISEKFSQRRVYTILLRRLFRLQRTGVHTGSFEFVENQSGLVEELIPDHPKTRVYTGYEKADEASWKNLFFPQEGINNFLHKKEALARPRAFFTPCVPPFSWDAFADRFELFPEA